MAHLENPSIGLTLDIDDQGQLEATIHDLVPAIKGSMSVSPFKYNGETLAYLMVLLQDDFSAGYVDILQRAFARHGYAPHGEMLCLNRLNYSLICLEASEDAQKNALVQRIQEAYDKAEFSAPVSPELKAVDFKALTLDGKEVGSEIFARKACTVITIWATTCKSCRIIMPELAAWGSELPENMQALYLTAEKEGIAKLDRERLNQQMAEFGLHPDQVLLYETGFSKVIDMILSATPTTFFADTTGSIVGEVILGSEPSRCKEVVNDLLSQK